MAGRIVKVDPEQYGPLIHDMHRVCFPDFILPPLHGDWWLAKDGDVLHGFAGLWPSVRVEGAGYLCRAGVLPAARGRGLQRKLIRVRERAAKKKGWTALFSDTDPSNAHSMNNLIACGYRAFRPSEPWSGEQWCYWRKILDDGVA